MGGVTVSAKAEGATITTSVYTDESGNYYFPPLPDGKYRVWAQALKFETRARQRVALGKTAAAEFRAQADHEPARPGSASCPATNFSPRCPATRRMTAA